MIYQLLSSLSETAVEATENGTSTTDIITRYLIYGAIIIVGLIVICIINRCSRPITPAKLKERCAAVKKSLQGIVAGYDNGKYSKTAGKRIKIYPEINGMIYAASRIIDEERDVTLEDVRSALQRALALLDEAALPSLSHADAAARYSSALAEIEKADCALDKINERRKKFGR